MKTNKVRIDYKQVYVINEFLQAVSRGYDFSTPCLPGWEFFNRIEERITADLVCLSKCPKLSPSALELEIPENSVVDQYIAWLGYYLIAADCIEKPVIPDTTKYHGGLSLDFKLPAKRPNGYTYYVWSDTYSIPQGSAWYFPIDVLVDGCEKFLKKYKKHL